MPDVVIAHPGWGESLFVKQVWPKARLALYAEFHYKPQGADVGFDREFPSPEPQADACRLQLKNINNLMHFGVADAAVSTTRWQAGTFPEPFRSRITVVHDGIDTEVVRPNAQVVRTIKTRDGQAVHLTREDEIITFINRNLEPYRGYHIFMRALPELLKRRPKARVLLVGGNDVSYGSRPDRARYGHANWKDVLIDEVRPKISDADWSRVHFLGKVPYEHFLGMLQLSTVHVYLTYPFVLSWSLIEAMSAGCAIVASDTAPVREVIRHDDTGRLVDFFDVPGLTVEICSLLDNPESRQRLGQNARAFAQANYDLRTVCLPRQLAWVEGLVR